MNGTVTLVLGGARSGKSRFAENLVLERNPRPTYLATAQAWDDEMCERIEDHKSRRGPQWTNIEAPVDIVPHLDSGTVLVDCLTLWVTNLMVAEADIDGAFDTFEKSLRNTRGDIVLVSNEVGLGIVPDNAMARAFRDHVGRLHQRIAAMADEVWFLVAGLPQRIK